MRPPASIGRMDTFRRGALGSLLALILGGVSGAAGATEPTEVVVRFADLDLDTDDGAAALYRRLEAAARIACTAVDGPSSRSRITSCIDYGVRQAVAEVAAPRLVVLYEVRSGQFVWHTRR